MRIALLTKSALDNQKFFEARAQLVEFLAKENDVGTVCYHPSVDELSQFDLGIGFFYPHILKKDELKAPRYGCINNHIGYLPQGRGSCPNVWAIAYGQRAGVTIHQMSEVVDEGDILWQKEIPVHALDTGETLYYRLLEASVSTLIDWWPEGMRQLEKYGYWDGILQDSVYAKTYRMKDLERLDDLESYFGKATARQFVDILRARTFHGYEGAFIRDDSGKKVYVRVKLSYD